MPFAGIGIHVYITIFAFGNSFWKGLLTLILPIFSEIYWFIKIMKSEGTIKNTYCIVIVLYAVAYIIMYVSPFIFRIRLNKE